MLAVNMDIFHRRVPLEISSGAIFRRRAAHDTVETAEVLAVVADKLGIDHVRYRVRIRRGYSPTIEEQRILSLQSFKKRFRERIETA